MRLRKCSACSMLAKGVKFRRMPPHTCNTYGSSELKEKLMEMVPEIFDGQIPLINAELNKQNFLGYKAMELKGDAIARLAGIEILVEKRLPVSHIAKYTNNKLFTAVAHSLELKPHPEDDIFVHPTKGAKNYANAFEVLLCFYYDAFGYGAAKDLFRNTAMKNIIK